MTIQASQVSEVFLVEEAAAELGLTAQRIRVLCRTGRFPGAELRRNMWIIPRAAVEFFKKNPPKPGRPVTTGAGLRRKDRREKTQT